jgi:hypothetical protein
VSAAFKGSTFAAMNPAIQRVVFHKGVFIWFSFYLFFGFLRLPAGLAFQLSTGSDAAIVKPVFGLGGRFVKKQ